ncbi:MAG: hypothetical protein AB7O24_09125 [Kofleriaceae bacterium]
MGRLDDIIARNKKMTSGHDPLAKVVNSIGGDDKPTEPPPPFTLPSQRRSGAPAWKVVVLIVLAVAIAIVGQKLAEMRRSRSLEMER